MIRVDYDQGSEIWKEWRAGGLGGSDAACIVGVAPAYWENSTRQALLEYKAKHRGGFERVSDKNKSHAMMRGTMMEPIARQAYRERTGNNVEPACVISSDYPFIRASCDGLNKEGDLVLEIKCVRFDNHEIALDGRIPNEYWPQVQHLLLATGAPRLHYFSYSTHKKFKSEDLQALVSVKPSPDYQKYLLAEEIRFWEDLQALIAKRKKP